MNIAEEAEKVGWVTEPIKIVYYTRYFPPSIHLHQHQVSQKNGHCQIMLSKYFMPNVFLCNWCSPLITSQELLACHAMACWIAEKRGSHQNGFKMLANTFSPT